MMHNRSFIREINGLRLSSNVQCRAKSIKKYSVDSTMSNTEKSQYVRPTKNIPGPKALPLLGNWFRFLPYIGEYGNVNVITRLRMLHKQYGNIVKLDGLMKRSQIFLFCPQLCEEMYRLTSSSSLRINLESLYYYRKNREDIYGGQYGLALSQGKEWRDFRSKVNPHMMQPQAVTMHVTQISEVTLEFVEKIRALRDPKTLEMPNNFMNELYKWSLESMCSIALGCRLGCLKPNLATNSESQIMIDCARDIFDLMHRLENLPLWKIYNTRSLKKFFRALDTLNEISLKYIERAKEKFRKTTDNVDSQNHSILEKLLLIDEKTAYVMAMDMLVAGIDTISNAASSLLYYIANNLEVQEKLREEVMSVLPNKTSLVTHDILNRVTYAKACIKEAMRLFPITIGIQRTMQKDTSIGGYRIPAGFNVIACHALISMESAQFPLPHQYIPERWLRDKTKFPLTKDPHPYAYMPFGYGVRTCIGRRFAEMELETLLLTIIRNFQIEWHHEPLKYKTSIINKITMPMRFKLIDL